MEQIPIISGADLIGYPGAGEGLTDDSAQAWADLANDEVWDHWPNPVDPIPKRVRTLTLEVAARASRNPKGLASWTRSVDDGSRTSRLPDAAARAGVFLTADEIVRLRNISSTGRRSRYGTVRPRLGWGG